jgi:plasmid stabilization system protein ParE
MSRKPMPVRWHTAARQDVLEIIDRFADDAPRSAMGFVDRFNARAALLSTFPYLGERCPDYRRARHLIEGNFIIYYTVHRHEVVIRAVVRGSRLFRRA